MAGRGWAWRGGEARAEGKEEEGFGEERAGGDGGDYGLPSLA